MSRKPKVVDRFEWYHDKSSHPITLDTDTGMFHLDLKGHDRRFTGKDLEKLREDASVWLEANARLVFEPVIVVRVEDEHGDYVRRQSHEVHFEYERAFRGKRPDGEVIWKDWQTKGSIPEGDGNGWDDCLEGEPAPQGSEPFGAEDAAIIPYTDEQWTALRKITKLLQALQTRLFEVKKSGKMAAFLQDLAKKGTPFLLPAPEAKEARGAKKTVK